MLFTGRDRYPNLLYLVGNRSVNASFRTLISLFVSRIFRFLRLFQDRNYGINRVRSNAFAILVEAHLLSVYARRFARYFLRWVNYQVIYANLYTGFYICGRFRFLTNVSRTKRRVPSVSMFATRGLGHVLGLRCAIHHASLSLVTLLATRHNVGQDLLCSGNSYVPVKGYFRSLDLNHRGHGFEDVYRVLMSSGFYYSEEVGLLMGHYVHARMIYRFANASNFLSLFFRANLGLILVVKGTLFFGSFFNRVCQRSVDVMGFRYVNAKGFLFTIFLRLLRRIERGNGSLVSNLVRFLFFLYRGLGSGFFLLFRFQVSVLTLVSSDF